MKVEIIKTVIVCFLLATTKVYAGAGSKLISNLNDGKQQTVVTYGTSLTARPGWVGQLKQVLNECYPGKVTVINSGQGAKWSKWGVDNLDKRVIEKKPDTLFIEFAINDAYLTYKTSVKQAQENLENMIDRVLKANPKCEIILMTMNPPVGKHLELRPMIKEYYQMYRDVAKARDFLLIDHYPEWAKILENDPDLFKKYVPDNIHPTREGCKAVTTPNIIKALGIEVEQRNVSDMAEAKIEIAGATILCLGDSITEGGKTFSVYRYSLNKKLVDAGYNVTFIGPKSATKGGVTLSHAGYGGKKTASLDKLFNGIYAAHI